MARSPRSTAIQLRIGQVYAFSVFKIPLTQLLGVNKSAPNDWKQKRIAWIFSLAIVMLGLSAAAFGKWLEGAGPRKAMFPSAFCFALGSCISYFGVIPQLDEAVPRSPAPAAARSSPTKMMRKPATLF